RRQLPRRQGGRAEREAPVRPHLRHRRGLRGGRGLRPGAAGRGDAAARPLLHAARLRHRDRRRARLDARRAARRHPDRRLRGARRAAHRALGEEHVQLRAADPGAALPASGSSRQKNMKPRASAALAVLAALLIAFPAFAGPYALSVATLILYFAYTGQAWNVMMGFAGQLSLGHALYVGVAGYVAGGLFYHLGIPPILGLVAAVAACTLFGLA